MTNALVQSLTVDLRDCEYGLQYRALAPITLLAIPEPRRRAALDDLIDHPDFAELCIDLDAHWPGEGVGGWLAAHVEEERLALDAQNVFRFNTARTRRNERYSRH